MKKESYVIESVQKEKNFPWKILITVIIFLLLLAIIIVISFSVYNYIAPIKNEANVTLTNNTNIPFINGSQTNTSNPKSSVCGDKKCNGTETYINCPNDCRKSSSEGGSSGGGTPNPSCISNCAGKNCGDDGCGISCGICNSTQYCNNGVCNVLGTSSSLTQYNITFYFDKAYEYGTFANGDYWVKGPVVITRITPDFSSGQNGFDVSPMSSSSQSLDSRGPAYNASRMPSLPYTAAVNKSIVKAISYINCTDGEPRCYEGSLTTLLKTASVLTVLGEVPPNGGSGVLRPAYSTAEKKLYIINGLKLNLLPSFEPVSNTPSLASVERSMQRVQLDHVNGWSMRHLHPKENMNDYGSDISNQYSTAILRLMLNDSNSDKMPALINTIQAGIDYYGMYNIGTKWDAQGGHSLGRKLIITFAGVMLGDEEIKNTVYNHDELVFDEDMTIKFKANAGIPLFAQTGPVVDTYWKKFVYGCDGVSGSKTDMDPYGWIDGGCVPGGTYLQCCLFAPYKAEAIAMYMMPEMKQIWNDPEFFEFINRKVYFGVWTQPDPCAPVTGICAGGSNPGASCTSASTSVCIGGFCNYSARFTLDYKVKYGPDTSKPGDCIRDTDLTDGIGRYPLRHGEEKDQGGYSNTFANSLWSLYRLTPCSNGIKDIDEDGVDCGGVCEVDLDGDGYNRGKCSGGDCDDNSKDDPQYVICPSTKSSCTLATSLCALCINQEATEYCDAIDNNCDGTHHSDYYRDTDGEGINNCVDNCPTVSNPGQEDSDYDSIGNACDPTFEFYETFEFMFDNNYSHTKPGGIAFENVVGSGNLGTSTHWGYNSKYLAISGPNEGEPAKIIVSKLGNPWSNYSLSLIAGHKYTSSGIIFHYKDPKNYYWISLRDSSLRKVAGGVETSISGSGDSIALDWGGNNKNYVINISTGSSLNVVVSTGTNIRTYTDSSPSSTSGRIGFTVTSGGWGNYFIADNIKISFKDYTTVSSKGFFNYLTYFLRKILI